MTATPAVPEILRRPEGSRLVEPAEMPPLTAFVDGVFDAPADGPATAVLDPARGEEIARVAEGTGADVDRAVAAARAALPAWRRTTPKDRADRLLALADRLAEHADLLMRLEALDAGKPRDVVEDDVASTVDCFRFAAGACRAFTEMGSAEYVAEHTSIIIREPLGVIGVVVPWNYPLLMAAWKIAPILAAGNTMVLKPAEQTPLSVLKLVELAADLFPAGVLNVVPGLGPEVGGALAAHPDVDMIALTGSVRSGRAVAAGAADSLKRVHLELGGKAPVVIFPDADLEAAADGVREAGYWNSGQECGAGTRVLVHEDVAERFTRLLVERVAAMTVGEPGAEGVDQGPMVSAEHHARVLAALDTARDEGATVACGGVALEGEGWFVAPTVLTDIAPDSAAAREEIFGPVVTVETFAAEDEAVDRANAVDYGLAASVWTNDAARSLDVPRRLDFGTVWVNTHLVIANELPWGGFSGSGYGRDLSLYALQDFSRTKHVQINHAR